MTILTAVVLMIALLPFCFVLSALIAGFLYLYGVAELVAFFNLPEAVFWFAMIAPPATLMILGLIPQKENKQ